MYSSEELACEIWVNVARIIIVTIVRGFCLMAMIRLGLQKNGLELNQLKRLLAVMSST